MSRLAIKGHETRGKEVIRVLEMLGGKNSNHCTGSFINRCYFINEDGYIESSDDVYRICSFSQVDIEELAPLLKIKSNIKENRRNMKVKIKKLADNAVIPQYAKDGDAGMDLTAVSKTFDNDGNIVYGTGLAFEIPKGYVGLLFPRSSNSKKFLTLCNSVGVLDSGYRGEVTFKFKKIGIVNRVYEIGDRIGQIIIMPYPVIEFEEVDSLSETERGTGGYGSTGN